MNPLRIQAQNLRTFERLDLELPSGCCVIGGENGAGKSTVLSAIDVALFAGRGELPPLLTLGEDELALELMFEHGGLEYKVRRGYSAKGRGKTTLDFEGFDPAQPACYQPLTRETAEQTQALIERTLGLSRATFRASSFLAQGDGAAFTEAQPRDRKAILAEILGLKVWDRLLGRARADLRTTEDELLVARGRISALEEEAADANQIAADLAEARFVLTAARDKQTYAAGVLDEAKRAQAANAAAVAQVEAADREHAAALQEQERVRQAYAAAVNAGAERETRQAELTAAAALADQVPALEQRLAKGREELELAREKKRIENEVAQREQTNGKLAAQAQSLRDHGAALNARADHLDAHIDEAGSCDRCGQKLGAEAAARAAKSYREEAAEALGRATRIELDVAEERLAIAALTLQAAAVIIPDTFDDVDAVEQRLVLARNAGERRAALAEQVFQLAELAMTSADRAADLGQATVAVEQTQRAAALAHEHVVDENSLTASVGQAHQNAAQAAETVADCHAQVVRLEVAAERAQAAAVELAEHLTRAGEFQRQIDLLKLAERAYGPNGIPALIVENAAIPQLELEANRILGELGGATVGCRVELRTQRALKTSDALRETLDIVIVTPTGERAYETFSGGERTRLNLALRIALARLLAHRRGAESRLLAIDEPDGLDAQGMDALALILQGLAGDFDKILVVSHQPQLATSFDQALIVVKDGDRSRLDAGAPLAEVAA